MAVAKFLDQAHAFSHLLFIDADMGFRPETLERMIVWDKDLVGCPGPTKYIHWDHVVDAILHGRDPEVHTLRYAVNFHGLGDLTCIDGFAQVKDFGLCFCLMKKEAVLTMAESYPELKCPHMGWQDGRPFESENAFMFFDTMRDDKENRYLECDHAFLARWRKIGGEIWADMTSDLIHVGTHHYHGDMALYFMGKKWQDGRFTAQQTPWGRYPREPDVEVSSAEK